VRELWRHLDAVVATRSHWSLLVQRVRPISQDQRHEQTFEQAAETAGEPGISKWGCRKVPREVLCVRVERVGSHWKAYRPQET